MSENGWTSVDHCLQWYTEWEKETRHYGLELVRRSREDNVVILGYPPHCTHALQGLDVLCFGPLKKAFHADVREFERLHLRGLQKEDFAGVFGAAFLRVFQPALIKKAFEVTGIYPFNPKVITTDKLAPSKTTCLKASFPQMHTSPVRAIMATFDHNPPTGLELSESSAEPSIDPALYTPSSWVPEILLIFLNRTTCHRSPDGNDRAKHQLITKVDNISQNLGHAFQRIRALEAVVAGTQAQLVVQDLTLRKQQASLFEKEKENNAPEESTRIVQQKKMKISADKAARKAALDRKREQKNQVEARWKAAMEEWKRQRKKWQERVDALKAGGTTKKNLPPPPKKPLKKDLLAPPPGTTVQRVPCDTDSENAASAETEMSPLGESEGEDAEVEGLDVEQDDDDFDIFDL